MIKEKKEGSIWFLISFVFGIAVLIYFQVYKKDISYYLENNYHFEIENSYNGIIERRFVDKSNHNSSMVKFKDGSEKGIHPYFWGKMQVGDSISKVKGDSVIQVFRNGEKIILEIAPFYEKAIKEQQKNN
ncbi:hypothetical protein [Sphingobacterium endophyticum]|uniref:hypothetical protein n=1 Tax=Sphingobacterium endophyticum TaxID=2546448 RepID=UPI0012E1CDFC|nr:hypothetical protein [Sphingobacterium endophyticum]